MGGTFGPLLLIGGMLLLVVLGVPIAYAIGIASLITALVVGIPLEAILLKVSDGVDNFSLLAIPFFVFAGALMAEGGMAWRLVNFANIFVGFIRGGLAMVNVLASMFFGGISGSSVADVSSIGSILIPMMKKQGYDDEFSVNITITSAKQDMTRRRWAKCMLYPIPNPPSAKNATTDSPNASTTKNSGTICATNAGVHP